MAIHHRPMYFLMVRLMNMALKTISFRGSFLTFWSRKMEISVLNNPLTQSSRTREIQPEACSTMFSIFLFLIQYKAVLVLWGEKMLELHSLSKWEKILLRQHMILFPVSWGISTNSCLFTTKCVKNTITEAMKASNTTLTVKPFLRKSDKYR